MRALDMLADFDVPGVEKLKKAESRCGGKPVGHGLQMLLWIGIVSKLLLAIRLTGDGAEFWAERFQEDYEKEVCGRYQAMEANLQSAVAMWRKLGCAGEEALRVEEELAEHMKEWREQYTVELENCHGVRLHRERNRDLDPDYPNWVVRYE
jgi:hypothetical protein